MKIIFLYEDLALLALKLSLTLSAFGAIALGPVPLPWLATIIPIIAAFIFRWNIKSVPLSLYALLAWCIFVQSYSVLCFSSDGCDQFTMPSLSTLPYGLFVFLRILPLVMIIAVVGLIQTLQHRREEIIDFLIKLGTVIALIALYVYIAQITGLPDIPRTRLGTDGQAVTEVAFTYSFHRALGTFREPSVMAVWLILPLFLSLRSLSWRTLVIGVTVLLSGSMTAYVSCAVGVFFAVLFLLCKRGTDKDFLLSIFFRVGGITLFSVVPFMLLVQGNDNYAGVMNVILDRLGPILFGDGILESNRGYVYKFASEIGLSLAGYGLGNINLVLSQWLGSAAVSGILSLYLNILLGLGIVGFIMLVLSLIRPLAQPTRHISTRETFPLYGAYFGWLTAFLVHSAEFSLIFAFTYGLILSLRPKK